MPLTVPTLDDRRFQDLLNETLARIAVHNPEWTNYNKSDPGVTLLELFAFLSESLYYRANLIPERNRRKFLQLLGIPLSPATSARGLVRFWTEGRAALTLTLTAGLELRAGQVPFRTGRTIDVLPIESRVFIKQERNDLAANVAAGYAQLYQSLKPPNTPTSFQFYEAIPLESVGSDGLDLKNTVDGTLWVALLTRPGTDDPAKVRQEIAGKTLSMGIVPKLSDPSRTLSPGGIASPVATPNLVFEIPLLPLNGLLPDDPQLRIPRYQSLQATPTADVLSTPGTVEITLPGDPGQLELWKNLRPLDPGADLFPPTLQDNQLNDRLLTWLRVRPATASDAALPTAPIAFLWAGINVVAVDQRARVAGERLPDGTGEPDQGVKLSRSPVLPGSVHLVVTLTSGGAEVWKEIDDLSAAGPEVPTADPRQTPGTVLAPNLLINVFALDAEAGVLRFGDGTRGRRPPFGATMRASYDYGVGRAGNVGPGAISGGPALPAGLKTENPVRTWGGADAESVASGEAQITRYLQHRDRLVTADDFATIARRTPGVEIGRVEVLPTFHPDLSPNEPGDAPGAVTLMIVPAFDPSHPDAPLPDQLFLDAICDYIDPRRLVTTEVFLRPPDYVSIWISIGFDLVGGFAAPDVRDAVQRAVRQFLSPLPPLADSPTLIFSHQSGWPLRKAVVDREVLSVVSRVPGVLSVRNVLLAGQGVGASTQIPLIGLQLPKIEQVSAMIGDPIDIDRLRGLGPVASSRIKRLPVPVIAEECC